MALSHQNNKEVYDCIRNKWIDAKPEEVIRQKLITYMVETLGYPKNVIAIEKSLSEFTSEPVPNRRLDILCFDIQSLKPLLLIECKSIPIQKKMFSQVLGYNAYIGAPLVCLVNQESIFLRWKDQEMLQQGLPTYSELVNACL